MTMLLRTNRVLGAFQIMAKRKTIWYPLKTIEDGVSLCFFSVDLSRRGAVLLRGGPLWKG